MIVALAVLAVLLCGVASAAVDQHGTDKLEALRDERAYFAALFSSDARCLHHASCPNPDGGRKNEESGMVYTPEDRLKIAREAAEREELARDARLEREAQKATRKTAHRIRKDDEAKADKPPEKAAETPISRSSRTKSTTSASKPKAKRTPKAGA